MPRNTYPQAGADGRFEPKSTQLAIAACPHHMLSKLKSLHVEIEVSLRSDFERIDFERNVMRGVLHAMSQLKFPEMQLWISKGPLGVTHMTVMVNVSTLKVNSIDKAVEKVVKRLK